MDLLESIGALLKREQSLHVDGLPLDVLDHLQHRKKLLIDFLQLSRFELLKLDQQQSTALLIFTNQLLDLQIGCIVLTLKL